jgi:hypothetical protein
LQFNPSSRLCGSIDRPGFAPGYGAHRIRLTRGLLGPGNPRAGAPKLFSIFGLQSRYTRNPKSDAQAGQKDRDGRCGRPEPSQGSLGCSSFAPLRTQEPLRAAATRENDKQDQKRHYDMQDSIVTPLAKTFLSISPRTEFNVGVIEPGALGMMMFMEVFRIRSYLKNVR